jgi:hypothetical protein
MNRNKFQLLTIGKLKKFKNMYGDLFESYESIEKINEINKISIKDFFINSSSDVYLLRNSDKLCLKTSNLKFIEKLIEDKREIGFSAENITPELGIKALKKGFDFRGANISLFSNKEFMLYTIKMHDGLFNASDELKDDKELVLEAVKKNGASLMWASSSLKDDKDVALTAVLQNPCAFSYISERLKNDEYFLLEIFYKNGNALNCPDNYYLKNISCELENGILEFNLKFFSNEKILVQFQIFL